MENLTIIIPIHEFDDDVKKLFLRAIKSIPTNTRLLIVSNKDVVDNFNNDWFKGVDYKIITSEDKTDFCTLVNLGAKNVETEWFSILEYDDEYLTQVFERNFKVYSEYKPETSVFCFLEELIDFNKKNFVGYGNEAPWATSFSNENGVIDFDCLENFFDFYLTGSVFNTKDWLSEGGLKPSIKVSFWYEFLLRLTNNSKKVYVIPKLGYKHYVNREDSLFDSYRKDIDEKESEWYFQLAKTEYFYKNDRNKSYQENNEQEED